MTDFLLELLTEEIPARMQAKAIAQLVERFTAGAAAAALPVGAVDGFVTPRRLVVIARDVAAASAGTSDERRGPRADAPEGAIAGFLKSTGLSRDQLDERDTPKGRFLYATISAAGRPAADILAELIPQIVAAFDWPKSMRWGAASASTASPRWVRPLSGIVALLGDALVPFAAAGVASGRTTVGHRFMSVGGIEIASAATYADQLRAAHVILDPTERARVIVAGAEAAARAEGLTLIPDAGLVAENAGLTEWPVPLLGRFDAAFLDVPPEVIQLTMRTNQKYFACAAADGSLAPAFVCVANLAAADGGERIVAGNRKVLAARLSDAKFFWDADLARVRARDSDGKQAGLASFTPKLADIVFHEKLGTVADKVERVAKLARWLVESGAVAPHPHEVMLADASTHARASDGDRPAGTTMDAGVRQHDGVSGDVEVAALATLAETAARLCKADLVSATVGEFPEVQGIAGGHLAVAQGLDPRIAAAIRDHYKPVGPSDEVPTAPVTVAVALADKLDTLAQFFAVDEVPTGSRDPFALRRAALGIISIIKLNNIRMSLVMAAMYAAGDRILSDEINTAAEAGSDILKLIPKAFSRNDGEPVLEAVAAALSARTFSSSQSIYSLMQMVATVRDYLVDRLEQSERDAGLGADVIRAARVSAIDGSAEDDLVRLVARAKALQAVLKTPDGASLLAGYRRGANIVRIEEGKTPGVSDAAVEPDLLTEPAEIALNAALDAAVPAATGAVAAEDFTAAMTALARLRPAVDAFFEQVTVNAHETALRRNRLALLARLRTAVHAVADFAKLEG